MKMQKITMGETFQESNSGCRAFYVKSKECGIELFHAKEPYNYNNNVHPCTSAPTLQMAMKWLREVHRLHCNIGYDNVNWYWDVQTVRKPVTEETAPKTLPAIATIGLTYSTYEEACEAAIKDCLENLI